MEGQLAAAAVAEACACGGRWSDRDRDRPLAVCYCGSSLCMSDVRHGSLDDAHEGKKIYTIIFNA